MSSSSVRGAVVYSSGNQHETISRHFSPDEKGTLLEYVLDSVWTVADELNVVFREEPDLPTIEALSPFGAKIFNVPKGDSPISTVLSAFKSSKAEHCILTTDRVPLLKPNVVLALIEEARGADLSIPRWKDGRIEPLLAVYRVKALLRLSSTVKVPLENDLSHSMLSLAEQLFDVKYLSIEDDLAELDPELDSFLRVEDNGSLDNARMKASVRGNIAKKSD